MKLTVEAVILSLNPMFRGIVGITVATVSFVCLIVIGLAALFLSLPDVRKLSTCMTTEMYHVYLCSNDPHFVPLAEISPNIIGAVIMSEDASFYSHQGVDLYEMKQSMKKDLNEMKFARGASTITQQLAKNAFLSKDKNVFRKLNEIYLALQIEKYFNKAKILTFYLNIVEFGDNIYGVKDACHHYFNKSPSEVTPEEGAFLAFLLPNPKKYSQSFQHHHLTPFANKTLRTILHKMMLGHKITEDEYGLAVSRVPAFPWNGEQIQDTTAADVQPTDGMEESGNADDDEFKFDFTPEEPTDN